MVVIFATFCTYLRNIFIRYIYYCLVCHAKEVWRPRGSVIVMYYYVAAKCTQWTLLGRSGTVRRSKRNTKGESHQSGHHVTEDVSLNPAWVNLKGAVCCAQQHFRLCRILGNSGWLAASKWFNLSPLGCQRVPHWSTGTNNRLTTVYNDRIKQLFINCDSFREKNCKPTP